MSYRIDYQGTKKVRGMEKKTASLPALAGLCMLALLAAACTRWPQGMDTVRALLIPGDPAVTVGALEELAAQLEGGESLRTAFQDFCGQVMELGAP